MSEKQPEPRDEEGQRSTRMENSRRSGAELLARREQRRMLAIGLNDYYASVASEPLPDEFVNLLNRLESGRPN